MGLCTGIWSALIPIALAALSMLGACKLAQPTQLCQGLQAQLEAVLSITGAMVMHDQELSAALCTQRAMSSSCRAAEEV